MLLSVLTCIVSFLIGGSIGKILAARGITVDTNLEKHHSKILWVIIASFTTILSMYYLSMFNLIHKVFFFVPTIVILYIGAYPYKLVLPSGFLVLGLLVFLELSGKSSQRRKRQLSVAVAILTVPLLIFFNLSLPVTNSVGESKITPNGVVLQTTYHTCAPASIATLARFTGINPTISEKDVVKLTMTNRFGTSTLAEIRAMEKLGLKPEYKYGLSVADLVKINRPAVLHVRVRLVGRVIGHAVALLAIDPYEKFVIVADPLSGLKKIKFDRLKGYWIGEAVFVMA